MAAPAIVGIHHVTAIASDPQQNLDFYTEILGLRLVKLTVNFDDPGTYHFYFGNNEGAPGSILTFFPWPGARRGSVGVSQVSATSFAVPADALSWWESRLADMRVPAESVGTRFGEPVLRLVDPDGLPLELVGTEEAQPALGWRGGPIDTGRSIGGFHSATLMLRENAGTVALLASMGFEEVASEGPRRRYRTADGGAGSTVDLLVQADAGAGRGGAGTVHHIAWRARDDDAQAAWRSALVGRGFGVTPVMDRTYFHSIYFWEPGGVLFEIATDPPGFTLDESPAHLGEQLQLPDWIGARRAEFEPRLPALTLPHEKPA